MNIIKVEQKENIRVTVSKAVVGLPGKDFRFEDYTPEQLDALKLKREDLNEDDWEYLQAPARTAAQDAQSVIDQAQQKLSEADAAKDAANAAATNANNAAANAEKLLVDYTHSGNKEVRPTAIDMATGTFTANEHGLNNGDSIFTVLELELAGGAALNWAGILPAGLEAGRYFVVNKTTDTFQISTTTGGTPLTFTGAEKLSYWHFERNNVPAVVFRNIPTTDTVGFLQGFIYSNGYFAFAPFSEVSVLNDVYTHALEGSFHNVSLGSYLGYMCFATLKLDVFKGAGVVRVVKDFGLVRQVGAKTTKAWVPAKGFMYRINWSGSTWQAGFYSTDFISNGTTIKIYKK